MNKYGRCVLTACCVLVGYRLLVWAMRMMNRPSDVSLYAGIAVVLGLVAAGPLVMRRI
jgi:hypothetical protein